MFELEKVKINKQPVCFTWKNKIIKKSRYRGSIIKENVRVRESKNKQTFKGRGTSFWCFGFSENVVEIDENIWEDR